MAGASKREIYFFHNDLTCLVLGLVGKVTTVDLKNEASVTGLLDQVDGFMNLSMTDAIYVDGKRNQYFFANFFIKARNVRYVHIPPKVRPLATIQNQLNILQGKVERPEKPKRTFRESRVQKNQKETLKLVEAEKKRRAELKKNT